MSEEPGAPSKNFGFLAGQDIQLVRLAALAETYFRTDPNAALTKLRLFGEGLARRVAVTTRNLPENGERQVDLLRRLEDRGAVPREAARLFHQLRTFGNKAAHEGFGDHETALSCLKFAWQLGVWFHRSYGGAPQFQPAPFAPPPAPERVAAALAKEIVRLREERAAALSSVDRAREAQEAAEAARLSTEERRRQEAEQREALERQLADAEAQRMAMAAELAAAQAAATAPPERVEALIAAATEADRGIALDEAATRTLIDQQLRDVGWEVDSATLRYAAGVRPARGRYMAIAEWPTESGPADYALFLGTTLVGMVEAKKRNRAVAACLPQAERYSRTARLAPDADPAGGPWDDFRVPFVFSANGRPYLKQMETESGIWFRDVRRGTNHARALDGWYSPDGLRTLLSQDIAAADAALRAKPFDFGFELRPYQEAAIRKVEEELAAGRRAMLLAMATGTGKTKLAIALLSRLLDARRFRRICFVVDRRTLGDQAEREFGDTRIVSTSTFAETFGIKGLKHVTPDDSTQVHICTIQGLVRRVLFPGDASAPPVDQYDLMVVDECHRGYLLDREMTGEEIEFRDQADYQSKYRAVLEHFDAVKIGLTATPALHTREIFGAPVFEYSYRQAVADRFLIDQEPPIRIETELSAAGIHWRRGEQVDLFDPTTGELRAADAPDDLDFDVEAFNRKVITTAFNRTVAEELARQIDPSLPDKTLIFAVNRRHADLVVTEVKRAMEAAYGALPDGAVRRVTGDIDRVDDLILSFRNNDLPKIAVTVDLLTTGIDVPRITNLVFLRRVNSRILYDQMVGRATRPCPEIAKETFRIFDAVDLYPTLSRLSDMKPVGVTPAFSFETLLKELAAAGKDSHREILAEQIRVKLRRRLRNLAPAARDLWQQQARETPEDTLHRLDHAPPSDVAAWLRDRPADLGAILDWNPARGTAPPLPVSNHPDAIRSVTRGYGKDGSITRPEDYIDAFAAFVRTNVNRITALAVVVQRPRDLDRATLISLRRALDDSGYPEAQVRRAWEQAGSADIAASIIGYVRQAALGDPLVPYADRVRRALKTILSREAWTPIQQRWLRRLSEEIERETVVDREALDTGQFRVDVGGYEGLNRRFGGRLGEILGDLNEEIWRQAS
ncbi:type I restriction-modification system endonuclease [Roseomonas sp. M0104]|uniref:Type I restriction-modification system endonuclease n=1 Tax=Teichococcus coralli TaxID=2545983 RepID=A0A845BF07_9PROT|nr:type I restriction-modification system endonuclease [Pseudoroseomonas coralli]MXP63917.1 type I restriction-modification system endonuclease [Pseudoroseomonas coralli]